MEFRFNNNSGYGQNGGSANNKIKEYSYYSRLKFRNTAIKAELTITYTLGLLKLEINELGDGYANHDSKTNIFLSQGKCIALLDQLAAFEAMLESGKIDEAKGFGVVGGMKEKTSYIAFHSNKAKDIIITIGNMDNNGAIIEAYDFTFAKEYIFSITWNNLSKNELVKEFNDMAEYNMLKTAIADFARFMNGALAYSVLDTAKYDYARLLNRMGPIYDALGIERPREGYSGGNRSRGNSFLNSAGSTSSSDFEDVDID